MAIEQRLGRERAADEPTLSRTEAQERFSDGIEIGNYEALLTEPVRKILREGAAIRHLDEELGAIRFALAKLLAEELDANKLATGVARLTTAAVQTMKFGQSPGAVSDASLAKLLDEIMTDLDWKPDVTSES